MTTPRNTKPLCDEAHPTARRRCKYDKGHAGKHGYRVPVDHDRDELVEWEDPIDRATLHTHQPDCCWNCHRGRATHPEGNDQACAARGEKPPKTGLGLDDREQSGSVGGGAGA